MYATGEININLQKYTIWGQLEIHKTGYDITKYIALRKSKRYEQCTVSV